MNLTQTQQQFINEKQIKMSDLIQDEAGIYVTVTSNIGETSKLYLPA